MFLMKSSKASQILALFDFSESFRKSALSNFQNLLNKRFQARFFKNFCSFICEYRFIKSEIMAVVSLKISAFSSFHLIFLSVFSGLLCSLEFAIIFLKYELFFIHHTENSIKSSRSRSSFEVLISLLVSLSSTSARTTFSRTSAGDSTAGVCHNSVMSVCL